MGGGLALKKSHSTTDSLNQNLVVGGGRRRKDMYGATLYLTAIDAFKEPTFGSVHFLYCMPIFCFMDFSLYLYLFLFSLGLIYSFFF